ncbi:MAG: iron-sulfur cluster assembly scaffold protein [Thermoplasmatales archaeon]|nr:iron-sulfur cluster assembly scaffold protein [Thermoplasmatales archaeon]
MYSEKMMEHFRNPKNMGEIENPDGVGTVGNPICVLPETDIISNPNTISIQNLDVGNKVLSHDGKYHKVIAIHKRKYKGEIITLKNQFGKLSVTPEHHILAAKSFVIKNKDETIDFWCHANDLKIGDSLLYPKKNNKHYFLYLPITQVKTAEYDGYVYNLEIKDAHSYVSKSATLHNCGDLMTIYIKIKDNRLEDVKFKTFGCAAAIATSSMITEMAKGKTIDEALKINRNNVADALDGLPPIKMHCSNLAADALHAAIKDYLSKKGKNEKG